MVHAYLWWKILHLKMSINVMVWSLTIHVITKFSPFCSIAYRFWDLRFIQFSKIFQFFWNFSKCSKVLWCHQWNPKISFPFALSLTVSEISANFCFFKFSNILEIFNFLEMLKNVMLLSLTMHVFPTFRPFRSSSNRF